VRIKNFVENSVEQTEQSVALEQQQRQQDASTVVLTADDGSPLVLQPAQEVIATEIGERLSPREELVTLADEWIAAASDEREKRALQATKEELLLAMDGDKRKR
jgi:DNA repair protein SbcD/Mre11